ncbi:Uncharacterized protein TCM_015599 [Theobroma cacao]|uniref:RING-type domain-containing protein n=1 Tax=Theobroma cacao TaxID=3641 RepID=A0A061G2M6_THECC|nr:Uncharacterized protein TCM_015599 [Theobroma cacao]
MGGLCFPCVIVTTTNMNSFLLTLLFDLLARFTFMLEEALVHLGLLNPTEEAHSADPYPTHYVLSMDNRSPSVLPAAPVQVKTTLIKSSALPVVKYGNSIRRSKVEEHGDEDDLICAVCLNYIEKSDEIKELSNCSHVFHRECLDTWINKDQVTCPLCRSTL